MVRYSTISYVSGKLEWVFDDYETMVLYTFSLTPEADQKKLSLKIKKSRASEKCLEEWLGLPKGACSGITLLYGSFSAAYKALQNPPVLNSLCTNKRVRVRIRHDCRLTDCYVEEAPGYWEQFYPTGAQTAHYLSRSG